MVLSVGRVRTPLSRRETTLFVVHILAATSIDRGEVLRNVQRVLLERAGVDHATVQVECAADEDCRSPASHA